ncbi:MAG: TetR/AcrR family transcriptional regulator, partial [Ktedonobacterales bacterium]
MTKSGEPEKPDEWLESETTGKANDSSEASARRNQILDAALEEFAAEGFRGATIKQIAKRAKLQSQALIYWYFPSKEALFQAVLGRHLPIVKLVSDPAALLDRPPEEVLSL